MIARNPGIEEAFPRDLREPGYTEGRNIVSEWRSAEGHSDRIPGLAAQLVRLRVDIIVAAGPEARQGAMGATSPSSIQKWREEAAYAKSGKTRTVPLNRILRHALETLRKRTPAGAE